MSSTIEVAIRGALIKREAEETFQLIQSPEWKRRIDNFVRTVASTTFAQLKKDLDKDMGSVDEFLAEVKKDVLSPEALRKTALETAKVRWQSRDVAETTMDGMYRELENTGEFGINALSELKRAMSPVLKFYDHQDRVINILVNIAQREGLYKAVTKEAYYKAVRTVFPTAERYFIFRKRKEEAFKKVSSGVQKAFAMDGTMGKAYGAVFTGISKGLDEVMQEVKDDLLKREIKEIYNVQL